MSRIDYEAMYEAYLDQIAAEPKIIGMKVTRCRRGMPATSGSET